MLYYIFYPLRDLWFGFNVFRYITFRAAGAAILSFLITVYWGRPIIAKLKELKIGEKIRRGRYHQEIFELHQHKEGTPTMGGVIILLAVMVATLCWCRLDNIHVRLIVASTLWMGLIGLLDDWLKLRGIGRRGLSGRIKLAGQVLLGLIIGLYLINDPQTSLIARQLRVPFYKYPLVMNMGIFSVFFTILVLVGTTNAVNLTDGLDGLAIGCLGIAALAFAALSYISGHSQFSSYLQVLYVPGAGELAVFCAALAGAALGFLWFNAYPAEVFMGDTGSLAAGGAIGIVAVLIRKELFLVLVGGVFVVEAVSVLIQVGYFKYSRLRWGTGRRVFLCTPLHHHFEKKGIPESKITIRFWIWAVIFALIALGVLKIR